MTGSTRARRTTEAPARRRRLPLLVGLLAAAAAAPAWAGEESEAFGKVVELLGRRCALPACHSGAAPEQGMSLEPGGIYATTVGVAARTDRHLDRVAPGDPDGSLLYRKLLSPAEGGYHGERMPRMFTPLSADERELVRRWIESIPVETASGRRRRPLAGASWSFHDSFLGNLPTTESLGKRGFQFRVVHRFRSSAPEAGAGDLFGMDDGAWVSIGLAYGLSERWEVGLRHSTLGQEEEGYFKVGVLRQGAGPGLSLSVVGSLANQRDDTVRNETSAGLQVVLARRFGKRVSLLAVPTYVTRTNTLDGQDDDGTLALGLGGEWHLGPKFAVLGEWVGQLSGVEAPYQSGTLGFSIRTARHAFQLLATNTRGAHVDLYAPGGDLDIDQEDFRLGFNLTRTFTIR